MEPEGTFTGTVLKDLGKFGFIQQDHNEDNMFVMPQGCAAFGGVVPPPGTRVAYEIVVDGKTERPRAENVRPEDDGATLPSNAEPAAAVSSNEEHVDEEFQADDAREMQVFSGSIIKNNGTFGFIQQDSGGENMFVMPHSCEFFGGVIPPLETHVVFEVVVDEKTGRPRAENVQPSDGVIGELAEPKHAPVRAAVPATAPMATFRPPPAVEQQVRRIEAQPAMIEAHTGTILKLCGSYGFIQQDSGEENMFIMPQGCMRIGGALPPVGTRVAYQVVVDSKTGRPRADDVMLLNEARRFAPPQRAVPQRAPPVPKPSPRPAIMPMQQAPPQDVNGQLYGAGAPGEEHSGEILTINGSFGFIQQDSGGDNMFVMPSSCMDFGNTIPPVGTRVVYTVVVDAKTGRPRAENVRAESPQGAWTDPSAGYPRGTILKDIGKYGFIQQDCGGDNMFVMPQGCAAFGGVIPPPGTRVMYTIVVDEKTGRPRAEEVMPEPDSWGKGWPASPQGKGAKAKGGGWGMVKGKGSALAVRAEPYAAAKGKGGGKWRG